MSKLPYGSDFPNYNSLQSLLLHDRESTEILLWPPDLFAVTSLILRANAAYQLVVSPPEGKVWPPKIPSIIQRWNQSFRGSSPRQNGYVAIFASEIEKYSKDFDQSLSEFFGKTHSLNKPNDWIRLIQGIGKAWRESLSNFDIQEFYERSNFMLPRGKRNAHEIRKIQEEIKKYTPWPVLLFWESLNKWVDENQNVNIRQLRCDSSVKGLTQGLEESWNAVQDLLSLHAIADEACLDWGMKSMESCISKSESRASEYLFSRGTMSTIDTERCRVLPKKHNPTVGITLRSLSSNLAFQASSVDVEINWIHSSNSPLDEKIRNKNHHSLNILLLPWPLRVYAQDFHRLQFQEPAPLPSDYNLFIYEPNHSTAGGVDDDKPVNMRSKLSERIINNLPYVIEKTLEETGVNNIDMVIFPEAAIDLETLKKIEPIFIKYRISSYIAGVRDTPDPKEKQVRFERNSVYFKVLKKDSITSEFSYCKFEENDGSNAVKRRRYRQGKHHRWKLDRSQIIKYNLGSSLDPKMNWREGIKISRRKVSFINLGDRLVICPLICEDLARQDPIASVIRTVGPSLVVAILMDGPQTLSRWPARYASVLADDPGSTVITLTSYGMVRRWNETSDVHCNSVALFHDGQSPPRELKFDKNASAILLNLCVEEKKETTLDGRTEIKLTPSIRFGGTKLVRLRPDQLREIFTSKNNRKE